MSTFNKGRVAHQTCPSCETILNAASLFDGNSPVAQVGDLTVCYNCVTPLMFNRQLRACRITKCEWADLTLDERDAVEAAQKAVQIGR